MHLRAIGVVTAAISLFGCPSKEGEQKDANAGGATPPPAQVGAPTGPLANLESSPFMNEVWTASGEPIQILFYPRENVRVSGQCRSPAGQIQCAALHQLRSAPPIEIPRAELDGRMSAGVKGCMKLRNAITPAVSQNGDEESFCRFPDGSLLSTGTLERYGIRTQ